MPKRSRKKSKSGGNPQGSGLLDRLRRTLRFLAMPAKVPRGLLVAAVVGAAFALYQGVQMDRARERLEREIDARRQMNDNMERMISFQDVLIRGFKKHAAQNGYAPERIRDSLRSARMPRSVSRGRTAPPRADSEDRPAHSRPRRSGGEETPQRERQ